VLVRINARDGQTPLQPNAAVSIASCQRSSRENFWNLESLM